MTNPGERKTSLQGDGGEARIEPGIGSEQLALFGGGPGARLRKIREAKKISLDTAAAELNMGPGKVQALERDDYTQLPEAVYIQGYLRNYARFLGEPVEPVLAAFLALNPAAAEEPVLQASLPIKPEISSNHRIVRLASMAIILVLVVLLFTWWGDYLQRAWWRSDEQRAESSPLEAEQPAAGPLSDSAGWETQDLSLSPMPGGEETVTPYPEEQFDSPLPDAAAPDETRAETPPVPEEGAPIEAGSPKIVFQFSAACWAKVTDAKGTVQLIGEFVVGDRRILEGEPPFQVVLGNAPAVELTVDGLPVDLMQHSRGSVARFALDPREP